jgi:hypothetical protein
MLPKQLLRDKTVMDMMLKITTDDLKEYANTTDKQVFVTDLFDCSISDRFINVYEQIVIDLCNANNITIDWKD